MDISGSIIYLLKELPDVCPVLAVSDEYSYMKIAAMEYLNCCVTIAAIEYLNDCFHSMQWDI